MKDRIISGGLIVLLLGGGWMVGQRILRVRQATSASRAMENELDVLGSQLRQISAERTARPSETKAPLPVASPAVAPKGSILEATLPKRATRVEAPEFFTANPEFHRMYLEAYRGFILPRYGPLFVKLGLRPSQVDQAVEVMCACIKELTDVHATAAANQIPMSDPVIKAENAEILARRESRLREVIGPGGVFEFYEYRKTLEARDQIGKLIPYLSADSLSPTPDQVDRLTKALADSRVQFVDYFDSSKPYDPSQYAALRSQARLTLSAQQFEVFDRMVTAREARIALNESYSRQGGGR